MFCNFNKKAIRVLLAIWCNYLKKIKLINKSQKMKKLIKPKKIAYLDYV